MRKLKIHYGNLRLFVNAGMPFPECHSNTRLLDTDKSAWPTTGEKANVTCGNCLKILKSKRNAT